MAYPTGMLSLTLEEVDRLATQIKSFAQRQRDVMAAGNVLSERIFDVHIRMKKADESFAAAASVPGIVQYARDQKDDQSLDVTAEFAAMRSAVQSVVSIIETTFPRDASDTYLLAQTWGVSGPEDREFTPAQTSSIRTQLQGVIDAIS